MENSKRNLIGMLSALGILTFGTYQGTQAVRRNASNSVDASIAEIISIRKQGNPYAEEAASYIFDELNHYKNHPEIMSMYDISNKLVKLDKALKTPSTNPPIRDISYPILHK